MARRANAADVGPAPEKRTHIEQILRTTGGTVDLIAEITGASRPMIYKTIKPHKEAGEIEIIGFEGDGNRKQKVWKLRSEEWPFRVGEYVEVVGERVDGMHRRIATLRGGAGAEFEVVIG